MPHLDQTDSSIDPEIPPPNGNYLDQKGSNHRLVVPEGTRFGLLSVVREVERKETPGGHALRTFELECQCGQLVTRGLGELRQRTKQGAKLSCGCRGVVYAGARFGILTMLNEAEPHFTPSGAKMRQYNMRCDCGQELTRTVNSLMLETKTPHSCGCLRPGKSRREEILPGDQFGHLTVLEEIERRQVGRLSHRQFALRCACGAETTRTLTRLKMSGDRYSCGDCNDGTPKDPNAKPRKRGASRQIQVPAGTQYGSLTVVRELETDTSNGQYVRQFELKCACGQLCTRGLGELRSRSRKYELTCGCRGTAPGTRFGLLTLLEELDRHVTSSGLKVRQFKVRCDCGVETTRQLPTMKQSGKNPANCGCLNSKKPTLVKAGDRYGHLTVLWELEARQTRHGSIRQFELRCQCGTEVTRTLPSLKAGNEHTSCGCVKRRELKASSSL